MSLAALMVCTLPLVATAKPAAAPQDVLGVPLAQLPASTRSIRSSSTYGRRDVLNAICGHENLEAEILDTDPISNATTVARAIRLSADARAELLCRREAGGELKDPVVVRTVTLPSDWVHFVELPLQELPKSRSDAKDGSKSVGLSPARCISIYRPDVECDEHSDVIAKWPEGENVWVFGQLQGVRELLSAKAGRKMTHPRAAAAARLLEAGRGLDIEAVSFELYNVWGAEPSAFRPPLKGEVGVVEGRDAQGVREVRILAASADDASRIEAQLAAHKAAEAGLNPSGMEDFRCSDCAPLTRKAYEKTIRLRGTADRASAAAMTVTRTGNVVVVRKPEVEPGPELQAARRELEKIQAQQREKLKPILDAWIAGQTPKPDVFGPIAGPQFVKAVRERMK